MRRVAATATMVLLAGSLLGAGPAAAGPGRFHIVQAGETAFSIARRYGLTVESLAGANGLADPSRLHVGQRLIIPSSTAATVPSLRAQPAAAPPTAGGHVVRPGDTLYRLARRYGTTVAALQRLNRLADDRIRVGQVLLVPSVAPAAVAAADEPVLAARPVALLVAPRSEAAVAALVDAGTRLTVVTRDGAWTHVTTPVGQSGWVLQADLAPGAPPRREGTPDEPVSEGLRIEAALAASRRLIGVPYVWGGASSRGVDCSGFVWLVYARLAPGLPRTSFALYQAGVPVPPTDLRPGDLVFFTTYAPGPSHVGIYLGDGQFVHGSSAARRVIVTSLAEPYYAARFVGARRLILQAAESR